MLSVLCSHPDIKAGGVLLLAPTGKATVSLLESMGEEGKGFTALNVAQFLVRSKRFDFSDMRYILSDEEFADVPDTVIIDESSMLTEEMFGALMQSLKRAKRIIFVGDPNQLPPIGAGRPEREDDARAAAGTQQCGRGREDCNLHHLSPHTGRRKHATVEAAIRGRYRDPVRPS